jgi:hypothetical protein
MKINKSALLLSMACLLPNAYSLSMDSGAKPTSEKPTYYEQAQELVNNNRVATGTILGALGFGLAYKFIPSVRAKLDNAVNKVRSKSRELSKEQQSIVRGLKCVFAGLTCHSAFSYINNKNFDPKKDPSFKNQLGNSTMSAFAGVSMGIAGLGVKQLYDGLVGYYI